MTSARHKICTGRELEDLNGAVALQAVEREHLFFSISFILQLCFIISRPFSVSRLFFFFRDSLVCVPVPWKRILITTD